MFVCKICGSEVKQGQAFCRTCGADVVDNYETVCPVCGTRNGAGSRYCAKCGGILPVMRKPVCAVCGSKNLPGAKYCVSCGAPISIDAETHSDKDMIEARKAKHRLDNMERDRMKAIDKEVAEKRAQVQEEKEKALKEIETTRTKNEEEYQKKLATLDAYKARISELGSEDIDLLKKISVALKDYSLYYADPYSQMDEDDIDGDTYVCPACGRVNPLNVKACTNCGRDKARALLLLAKNKIKQCPPVKRKEKIIPAPEEDLSRRVNPTLEEFEKENGKPAEKPDAAAAVQPSEVMPPKEAPADFSGPAPYGYPYPPYGYPYGGPQYGGYPYYYGLDEQRRQMPPIVQPVAFVPYVTQEQPLMQYTPELDNDTKQPARKPMQAPQGARPPQGAPQGGKMQGQPTQMQPIPSAKEGSGKGKGGKKGDKEKKDI